MDEQSPVEGRSGGWAELARRWASVRADPEAGMSTAEYAVGTVAACAFAAVLYQVVTGGFGGAGPRGPGQSPPAPPFPPRAPPPPPGARAGWAPPRPRGARPGCRL